MFESLIKKGLSHERLHTLLKVSEAGSLIKAANHDPGKQSRLSHQLQELSGYFGVELTERAGRITKLTAAGETLARLAREHFLSLQSFHDQTNKLAVTLKICAGDNLLQWLVVPAIGSIRRPGGLLRFDVANLRTADIVERLKERKIDFGLLRADAVVSPLEHVAICEQSYAVFVPRRLVQARGLLTIKEALLDCPHAAIGEDSQLLKQLNDLATSFGKKFVPELVCDSIGQCVAAVKTGMFAAVLPVHVWSGSTENDYLVVEDQSLDILKREIALVWHPRTIEVKGSVAFKTREALIDALKQESAQIQ